VSKHEENKQSARDVKKRLLKESVYWKGIKFRTKLQHSENPHDAVSLNKYYLLIVYCACDYCDYCD